MIDVTEILVHWHAGRSLNEMSGSLGVDRKTIRKYIAPAVAAGITPGSGLAKSEQERAELVREWFPELCDTRLRQVTWPAIGEHHDYIAEQLRAGVRMSTIHQRLRDERGLAAGVASFRRYVAANRSSSRGEFHSPATRRTRGLRGSHAGSHHDGRTAVHSYVHERWEDRSPKMRTSPNGPGTGLGTYGSAFGTAGAAPYRREKWLRYRS